MPFPLITKTAYDLLETAEDAERHRHQTTQSNRAAERKTAQRATWRFLVTHFSLFWISISWEKVEKKTVAANGGYWLHHQVREDPIVLLVFMIMPATLYLFGVRLIFEIMEGRVSKPRKAISLNTFRSFNVLCLRSVEVSLSHTTLLFFFFHIICTLLSSCLISFHHQHYCTLQIRLLAIWLG